MEAAVRFRDVTVSYDRHPAIHHVDFALEVGAMAAVVGPNGAGKSTLLKAILGLVDGVEGRVERPRLTRRDIAYLPQQAEIDRDFPISVRDAVALGLWHRVGAFGAVDPSGVAAVARAIAAVGLSGFEARPIASLSAGQRQRMLFARLLLQDAKLILLDEPFAAIDAKTTADLLRVVRRWHHERRTVLCVLHDLDQVRAHFHQTLLLARTVVAWGPTASALAPANLLRARGMAEFWDEDAPVCATSRR